MSHSAGRIQGIIFDMGDILFDASLWRRWLAERLRSSGVSITYDALVQLWENLLVDVYEGRAEYWNRFNDLIEQFSLDRDTQTQLIAEAKQRAVEVQKERELFEGVKDTLADLRVQGLKLAVLSDNESGEGKVREILRDLEIEQYFDAVVTSADIGYAKPNPEAYRAAAKKIGIGIEHCGFVGHDIDELDGALEAGILAIGYNYHPDARADRFIEHFSDLTEMVGE